jgi:hypothetical protein
MVATRKQRYSESPQPAPQKPRQAVKTKKGGKKAGPTAEEDEDAVDKVEDGGEADNPAASDSRSGKKRPTAAVDEGPSQKVRKTGAAGPSNRKVTRSGPPAGDAASGEQPPAAKKGNGKGKGKGKGKEK